MAQSSGTLLFINKTSRSASLSNSRSDRTSRKKINQHVQQTRDLDSERHARIQRLKPSGFAHSSGHLLTTVRPVVYPAVSLPTPPSSPSAVTSSIGTTSPVLSEDEDVEEVSAESDLAKVIPERGTVEPFGVCTVSLDNERYRILQYFVLEMFPTISRSDTPAFFTGPVSPDQEVVRQMVRDCLTDEMHTYALLTASSARMKFVTRAPFSQLDLPERYADTTMQLLRTYLSQDRPIDERLILTILFLWASESYRKDWKAVKTHQEMIKYLYTTRLGGFQNLSYHLKKMLWFGDRFQATATATPPVFEEESWEPPDISPGVVSRVMRALEANGQAPMGAAFGAYSITFFTPEFRVLVHEVTILACVVQCYWTKVQESLPDPDWISGRSHAMLDKLLFFKDTRSNATSTFGILLQDCVRLALITWLAFVGSPMTGVASKSLTDNIKIRVAADARPLRPQFALLIAHVHKAPLIDQQPSIDRLCLWIAGLGAVASELKGNIQFFLEHSRTLAEKLDIDSWASFTRIGRSFLWLDRLESVNGFRLTRVLKRQSHEASIQLPHNTSAMACNDRTA